MEPADRAQDGGRRGVYGQRPSSCHDELLRREFARIAAMSARERMEEALGLDLDMEALVPTSRESAAGKEASR
jgi:hypothetical protein